MRSAAALLLAILSVPVAANEAAVDVLHFDGFESPAAAGWRLGQLALRDPHVFYPLPIGPTTACIDATDLPNIGLNPQIAASLSADDDANGTLDSSALLVFRPLRTDGAPGRVTTVPAACSVATPTQCAVDAGAVASTRIYRTFLPTGSDHCLEPLPGTTSSWGSGAAVPQPGGACYATAAGDLVLESAGLAIPLFDTAFGAPLPGAAPTGGGLMRGFLRASDAAQISVDANGTQRTLASLLPGGAGSCKSNVTGGVDTWNGETGWWFYFEYRQDAVTL